MSDPIEPPPPPRLRLWATVSGLLIFGLTLPLWNTMEKIGSIYDQAEVEPTPWMELVMILFGLLWLPAVAIWLIAQYGSRNNRAHAAALFFRLSMAIVALQFGFIAAAGWMVLRIRQP